MSILKIKPLPIRFHCYKVLPLVYDDALSYYEQLCKILYSLNETIKAVNDLNDAVSDLSDNVVTLTDRVNDMAVQINLVEIRVNDAIDYLNRTIADYDARFDALEEELTAEIENNVKALKEYIDDTLANIETQVNEIVEKEITIIYQKFDEIEDELREDIAEEFRKLIAKIPDLTNIEVVNPVTGTLSKVQAALDDIFMNTRYKALTIDEFNHLHLSINECNTLMYRSAPTGWSIITWLTEAKELFNKNLKHRMANAFTGTWQDFKKSIEENTDMLRVCGCLTASEFGALNLTVDDFNEVGATCEQLAWQSNRIFV